MHELVKGTSPEVVNKKEEENRKALAGAKAAASKATAIVDGTQKPFSRGKLFQHRALMSMVKVLKAVA